jgi:hypothetical protein
MLAEMLRDGTADGELLYPAYWLVFALPWPGGNVAEGVLAVAPGMISRDVVSKDASQILAVADQYASGRGKTVVFFSELTRGLTRAGVTWADYGIDWERALTDLERCPGLYMAVSERTYMVICRAAARTTQAAEGDRDLVRAALAEKLGGDWPPYMRSVIDASR